MNIQGIGCAAHILHNALQRSADIIPIDVEAIVNKIFQYFLIYMVCVEELPSLMFNINRFFEVLQLDGCLFNLE